MSDWDSGYITEIDYTYGYYTELNPLHLQLAFLNAGIMLPKKIENACELGFGQGLSANIHASASNVKWYGTDFNPSQASFAQDIAITSENGAKFYDMSFNDFRDLDDLPEFDYIGLHGIWSWIPTEHQESIVEFIRKKLKVGGVVYSSYNVMPGWASFAPIQHLMKLIAASNVAKGDGIINNIEEVMTVMGEFFAANPEYAKANPSVVKRFKRLDKKDKHYIAHEYFNNSWEPMYFADIHKAMQPAKLDFACSANYIDHLDDFSLTKEQQKFYGTIQDPIQKQSVRDFLVNKQFRKDFWVKGARKMTAQQQREEMIKLNVMKLKPRKAINEEIKTSIGVINLNPIIYEPILDIIADGKIHSIAEIQRKCTISFKQLMRAIIMLQNQQGLVFCNDEKTAKALKVKTDKINRTLVREFVINRTSNYLASPVTGGGIILNAKTLNYISALHAGKTTPEELNDYVSLLEGKKNKILNEDKAQKQYIMDIAQNHTSDSEKFLKYQLPFLERLLIV